MSIQKLLSEKESLLSTVTPSSPQIKNVNNQIELQKKLLVINITSLQSKMRQKYIMIKAKVAELESSTESTGSGDIDYLRMMRNFNINEKYYYLLLEKRIEFYIANAGFVAKILS